MKMNNKIVIIGIDSLDPYILKKYLDKLPNFSKLIKESQTLISKSIFPIDTVPAWSSIFTGLNPDKHGVLYVYDIFDPKLDDLRKINVDMLKGKTFWDHVGKNGLRSVVIFPNLIYPAWKINGVMVSRSPIDRRRGSIETDIDIDTYPKEISKKYDIPKKLTSIWGGFPGKDKLKKWSSLGMDTLKKEEEIALSLYKNENWDLFFVYFSTLDIIQHRLWRFFDESDPIYVNNALSTIILEFYKKFDSIISEFASLRPDAQLIIISDHGHKTRPSKTVNINEYLRRYDHLVSRSDKRSIPGILRNTILAIANKFQIEHLLIDVISKNKVLLKTGKSIYSSSGGVDINESVAQLSTFAGIKSYSYGGIDINRNLVIDKKYEILRSNLIKSLSEIKNDKGDQIIKWISRREERFNGEYAEKLFPDIIFELKDEYAVGWDLYSDIFGKAYDHTVASGGHAKDAVFLMKNIPYKLRKTDVDIIDIMPTILDLADISYNEFDFDGKSIFVGD